MNEVEVWTVAVGNLPMLPKFLMPKGVKEAIELIPGRTDWSDTDVSERDVIVI